MSTKTRYESYGIVTPQSRKWHQRYYDIQSGNMYFEHDERKDHPIQLGSLSESLTGTRSAKRDVNGVDHEKVDYRCPDLRVSSFNIADGDRVHTRVDCSGMAPSIWDIHGRTPPVIDGRNISVTWEKTAEELMGEAVHAFHDSNETDNLLNIVEAGQTIRSLRTMGAMLSSLKNNGKGIFNGWKPKAPNRHKFSIRDISNMYLAWSFGFAPLISDAKKVAKALPSLRNRVTQLARNSAAPRRVSRQCYGDFKFTSTQDSGYNPNGDGGNDTLWWSTSVKANARPIRIAGVYGQRGIAYGTEGFQNLDYLLRRFIATGPISLAWETVKFSFAVDWFVNLTGVIDTMDNALTGTSKKIVKSWTSDKYDVDISVKLSEKTERRTEYSGSEVARYSIKSYHRKPMKPDNSVRWSGRFGKKQSLLSLALIHQYVANLSR